MPGVPTPDRETFCARAREATLVPVWAERLADLDTPVGAFAKVAQQGPAFLLESVEGGERWAAWSFVGCDPLMTLVGGREGLVVRDASGRATRHAAGDPVAAVESALASLRLPPRAPGERVPRLVAGAVGWIGYDVVRAFERLPEQAKDDRGLAEVSMMVPGTLVVFDNLRQVVRVVANAFVPDGADPDAAYDAALTRLEATLARLSGPVPDAVATPAGEAHAPAAAGDDPLDGFVPDVTREAFEAAALTAREHVHAGDCIQTVLSQRFTAPKDVRVFDVYRALRTTNPSPYMYYLRLPAGPDDDAGEVEVAGASPEVLVRTDTGEVVVRPIAGTRRRGATDAEDSALEQELLADPKERAEHVMLVDLGRNDVGRIARPGTVRVDDLMVVERYSHVMHLVSEVRGRLAEGTRAADVVRACFPAGTLSGAPKVRAMEIIESLEPVRRGLYGGAVGYLGLDGQADLAICIRTLVAHGDRMWVQSGAGIVADSVPEREYQETIDKARSVLRAVALARGGLAL